MRKMRVIWMLWALFITGVLAPQLASAGKPSPVKTPDMTELNRTLRETVKSPDFVLNWEEEGAPVWVTFEMTSNGKIDILNIKAPTPRVEQYVRKKLSGIQIANLVNPEGLRYQVKIRFINN